MMARTREQRVAGVHEVAQGQLTAPAAAVVLSLSGRQVRRLAVAPAMPSRPVSR